MARRSGEKHSSILEAAVKCFARNGYHRTRVADIAREAGVADGTVYIYFNSKEDILISMFQDMMNRFVEGLNSELSNCLNPEEKMVTLIDYHLRTLADNPDQAMVTQIELRQIDQAINKGISGPLMSYFRIIEEVIGQGKEQGLYRKAVDTRTARKIVFGAVDEVVTCWVMSAKKYDLTELKQPLVDVLVKGLQ